MIYFKLLSTAPQVTLVEVNKSSEQPLASWGEVTVDKPRKARSTASGLDTVKKARA